MQTILKTSQDYSNLHIAKAEQEVRSIKNLPTEVLPFTNRGNKYLKQYLTDQFISRANKPKNATKRTAVISKTAQLIAAIGRQKLRGSRSEWFMSDSYMSKVTGCQRRQNSDIIKQLNGTKFDITRCRKRKGWVLKKLEFEIISWQNIANSENSAKSINKRDTEYNYRAQNNSSKRTRSMTSNSVNLKNSNSKISNNECEEINSGLAKEEFNPSHANQPTTEPVETAQEAQAVETTNHTPATVTPIQTKPSRPSNKRKTRIKAEEKQRKAAACKSKAQAAKAAAKQQEPAKIIRNGFLGGGKRLSEIQPYLTDEVCEHLRSSSGREFTDQAIRQITMSIAASTKGREAFFYHINGVKKYLTEALANEKRDAVKTSGEQYYTLAGMSAEDKLWHQQEKYLEETEQIASKQPCQQHQFRAKLANTLERSTAYNLLLAMQSTSEVGNTLLISLNKPIDLSKNEKTIVLKQAQAVFNTSSLEEVGQAIESLEFVVSPTSWQNKASTSSPANSNVKQEIELPEGNWGKVCGTFVVERENGEALYNHWLAGLSVEEEANTIQLKTSSDMVRDRIEQSYLPFLNKIAREFGISKVEFVA